MLFICFKIVIKNLIKLFIKKGLFCHIFICMASLFNANVLKDLFVCLEIILSGCGMLCPNLKRVMVHIFCGVEIAEVGMTLSEVPEPIQIQTMIHKMYTHFIYL